MILFSIPILLPLRLAMLINHSIISRGFVSSEITKLFASFPPFVVHLFSSISVSCLAYILFLLMLMFIIRSPKH